MQEQVRQRSVPAHVAIIMDGNNRWAKARHLPGIAGHKAGVDAVRAVIETCARAGVKVLTLFAFSSENWRRPQDEVSALMGLFLMALRREVRRLAAGGVRLCIIGDRSRFSAELQRAMAEAEAQTADGGGMLLQVAANYGGQWDITQACRQLAGQVAAGQLQVDAISPELLGQYLVTADQPPVDLCIRTGGERRISNFLLWQMAYAELYFSELYWPDFQQAAMTAALEDFAGRQRRFGRTSEQVLADQGKTSC